MSEIAYIALGSNLNLPGETSAQIILAAMDELNRTGTVTARSSLYRTQPVGYADQPVFINAVTELSTPCNPEELLQELLLIERRFGRDRSAGILKGPRTLDLDLLLMGDRIYNSSTLTLPHPALTERRFVLVPLSEIAPQLRHPICNKTISQLLHELPDTGANRIEAVQLLPNNAS